MATSQRWLQFRLRDLFAFVTIAAIFFGLGLPWLLNTRELARDEFCRNKLRQIGLALQTYADLDPNGRFCSGQTDFEYVGSPDKHGWMADVMNTDFSLRGRMSCPANPIVASEMVNGLYTETLCSGNIVNYLRSSDGFCGAETWHNLSAGPGQEFAGTLPNTPERASFIARVVADQGLATNYVPSWFLTQSAPRLKVLYPRLPNGNYEFGLLSISQSTDLTSPDTTIGGLTRRTVETGPVVPSCIPVLGDGSAQGTLAFRMSYGSRLANGKPDPLHDGTSGFRAYQGARLAANTTRGPVRWNPATSQLDSLRVGVGLRQQACDERQGVPLTYMQDTRQWQAWHRVGKHASCNLLMVDGSVLSIEDQNGDGLLNPGFPVPAGLTAADYASIGYRDGTPELIPARVFSGVFLQNLFKIKTD